MISAKQAKEFSRNFEESKTLLTPRQRNMLNKQDGKHVLLESALAGIYDNVRNGFTSHITRALDTPSINMLRSHGYKIETEIEEDDWYYIISW